MGIDAVLKNLRNIQELNGTVREISVNIQSNGREDRLNPAEYGAIHDGSTGRTKFNFSKPALENFGHEVMDDTRVREYFQEMLILNKKRRSAKSMDKAAELMAEIALEKVVDYIMFEMPQISQPWKKSGERNLVETTDLLDAIYSKVVHNNREIWRG